MVKKRGGARPKMSVGERTALQQEKAELEAHVNENENPSFSSTGDKTLTLSRLKEVQRILDSDADNEAKGRERASLQKRQVELSAYIKINVPPYHIQNAKPGTPEYNKAQEWGEAASRPEVVRLCEEYQQISRMLDPNNPQAGDIEVLTAAA